MAILPIGQVPKRPKFGSGLKPGQLPASVSGQQRPWQRPGQQSPQGFGQPPRFGEAAIGGSATSRVSPQYQPPTVPVGGRAQATPASPRFESVPAYPTGQPTSPGYQLPIQPPLRVTPNYPTPQGPHESLTDDEFLKLMSPGWEERMTPAQIAAIRKEQIRRGSFQPYQQQSGIDPQFRMQGPPPYQPGQAPEAGQPPPSGYQPPQYPSTGGFDPSQQLPGQTFQPFQQQQPGGFPSPEITSGITPQPVFAPYQTQTAVNQAMASGQQAALTPGQGYLPGISQGSPALQSRGVVDQANALASGYQQSEQIRLGDRMTNIQALLQGQQARAQDVLGQAGNRFGISATNQQYGNQMANLMLSSILSRLGGAGNLLGQSLGDRDFWARLGLTGQQGRTQDVLSRFGTLGQLYDTGGY